MVQPDVLGYDLLENGSISTGAAVRVQGELVDSPGRGQKVNTLPQFAIRGLARDSLSELCCCAKDYHSNEGAAQEGSNCYASLLRGFNQLCNALIEHLLDEVLLGC